MPCDCHAKDNVEIQRHVLALLLAINATTFCFEVVAGILANSTALLADSLDMVADATIYGIALYAVGKPGMRQSNPPGRGGRIRPEDTVRH